MALKNSVTTKTFSLQSFIKFGRLLTYEIQVTTLKYNMAKIDPSESTNQIEWLDQLVQALVNYIKRLNDQLDPYYVKSPTEVSQIVHHQILSLDNALTTSGILDLDKSEELSRYHGRIETFVGMVKEYLEVLSYYAPATVIKNLILPSERLKKIDQRRIASKGWSNSEIAYVLDQLFGATLKRLSKDEQILILNMITDRSGKDMYNYLSRQKVLPAKKADIDLQLTKILTKIKRQ